MEEENLANISTVEEVLPTVEQRLAALRPSRERIYFDPHTVGIWNLNDVTFIIQNLVVSGLFKINDKLCKFLGRCVITIVVGIIFWLWT